MEGRRPRGQGTWTAIGGAPASVPTGTAHGFCEWRGRRPSRDEGPVCGIGHTQFSTPSLESAMIHYLVDRCRVRPHLTFLNSFLRGCKGFDGIHGLVPIHKWLRHYVNDGQGLDSLDPGPSGV